MASLSAKIFLFRGMLGISGFDAVLVCHKMSQTHKTTMISQHSCYNLHSTSVTEFKAISAVSFVPHG